MTVQAALPPAGAELIPGISPAVYGPADFAAISAIVQAEAGIQLPSTKAMLVYSRLSPLVRTANCGTFANYVGLIKVDAAEQARAVAALTTNHTFFWREAHHFEHFGSTVRPGLVDKLARGGKARIWSAGCSNGDETWSLVMTLLGGDKGAGRRIAAGDVAVLATDLAPHALAKAEKATYAADELKPVPEALRNAWATVTGEIAQIDETARSLVRFRQLNLLHDWPMRGRFDVIFCRNVMIYFDGPTKERLVARFADHLEPGGHLYIGHSERVAGPAEAVLQPVGPTVYRKKSA